MSQVTTHVLDTSIGKPATGISTHLYQQLADNWQLAATGITNADGRVSDMLAKDVILAAGIYKLQFATQAYFNQSGTKTFYPLVEIIFQIDGNGQHYHVPLLLNPFGYATYRGS